MSTDHLTSCCAAIRAVRNQNSCLHEWSKTMKTISFLATVAVLVSSPAMSLDYANQAPQYSQRNSVDHDNINWHFAKVARQTQRFCSPHFCSFSQKCCVRFDADGDPIGHICVSLNQRCPVPR